MHLIGIAGQMRAGKTLLANHLQIKLGDLHWKRGSLARKVKQIFMDTFGVDAEFIEKWKVIDEPPPGFIKNVRQSLQFIGDGLRSINPNVWLDLFFQENSGPSIVDDERYLNELEAFYKKGGFNILVVRPDKINDDPNGSEAQMRVFAEHAMMLAKCYDQEYNSGYKPAADDNIILVEAEASKWISDGIGMNFIPPPEGWQYLHYVVINKGSLEDFYQLGDDLIPVIQKHFERQNSE